MKKTILLVILLSICFSCKKEKLKSDFIGNWSSTSNTNFKIDIQFFNDSMIYDNLIQTFTSHSSKWKVYGSKIDLTILRGDKSIGNTNYTLNYKFNSTKDSLFIKNENAPKFLLELRKIKNNYEYFENRNGIELELPKTSEKLIPLRNQEFAFNIYISKKEDSLIVKTNKYLPSLDKLKNQIIPFYDAKEAQNVEKLKYILYVDTSVRENELDSIKAILKKFPIKKFFRIYHDNQYTNANLKSKINWLGKFEN